MISSIQSQSALRWALSLLVVIGLVGCSRDSGHFVSRSETPPSAILIRNVAVLDVEAGRVVPAQDVLIRGAYIDEIGAAETVAGPPDAEIIDGSGQTLIPGLVDAHAHVLSYVNVPWKAGVAKPERNLESFLYTGVTTVFDTGESSDDIFKLRDAVDEGALPGPRLYVTGKTITAPDGHPVKMVEELAPWWIRWYLAPRVAYQVDSARTAENAVARNEKAGADFIKVVVDTLPGTARLIDRDTLKAVVDAAHERNLRVVAHIGSTSDAIMAGEAGVDLYVHGVYMDRIPDEAISTIAAFGIPMVPTVVVFNNAADINRIPYESTQLERELAPASFFESYNEDLGGAKVGQTMVDWLDHLNEIRPVWKENILRLHEAGVTMISGSDFQPGLIPGASVHREFDLLHEAGLSSADVLRAATLNPARFLTGSDDPEFGTVQSGKQADVVLVQGNPMDDLEALHNIQDVIVGGVRLTRKAYGD